MLYLLALSQGRAKRGEETVFDIWRDIGAARDVRLLLCEIGRRVERQRLDQTRLPLSRFRRGPEIRSRFNRAGQAAASSLAISAIPSLRKERAEQSARSFRVWPDR